MIVSALRGKKKNVLSLIFVFFIIISVMFSVETIDVKSPTINFTLVAKTNSGGVRPDYFNLLRQYLLPLGINLEIVIQDWPTFVGELIAFRDFDICYVGFTGGGADPDFTGVYDENGSLNLFGYHTSMDWDEDLGTGINEWYMKQGLEILDLEERKQHYWDWQDYLMDKICPMLPTFSEKIYRAYWNNLQGYNLSKGIFQSWGSMYFEGSHPGQVSTDELVISDSAWSDLNPLFQDDDDSSFITSGCLDRLFWYDSNMEFWPHMAESIEMITDTQARIVIREGIKWAADPEGNFTNEFVDADDVYFTFRAWSRISSDIHQLGWIDYMQKIDDRTIDFYIDGDSSTPEKEVYASFMEELSWRIIPEHYLNQSQLADGRTPDITHPSWNKYALHCFGSGLFEMTEFIEDDHTILTVRPDSWWLNETITSDPALDWDRRFGDFSNYLNQLRVEIIEDLDLALGNFKQGKLDLERVTQFRDTRKDFELNPEIDVQSDLTYSFGFIGYNMRQNRDIIGSRELCPGDPTMTIGLAVRKAISYATSREEMNNIVNAGDPLITDWPMYPKMGYWCNPNIIRYNYDLNKAKELMHNAGFIVEGFTPSVSLNSGLFILSTISIMLVIFISKRRKRKSN
jgi:ABC-type transport system substrate-binding protein